MNSIYNIKYAVKHDSCADTSASGQSGGILIIRTRWTDDTNSRRRNCNDRHARKYQNLSEKHRLPA